MKNEVNGDGTDSRGIRTLGAFHDLTLVNSRIGNSPKGKQRTGIFIGSKLDRIYPRDNDLSGNIEVKSKTTRRGRKTRNRIRINTNSKKDNR